MAWFLEFWSNAEFALRVLIVIPIPVLCLVLIRPLFYKIHPDLREAHEQEAKQREEAREAKIKTREAVLKGEKNLIISLIYIEGSNALTTGDDVNLELTPTDIFMTQYEVRNASLSLSKIINAEIVKTRETGYTVIASKRAWHEHIVYDLIIKYVSEDNAVKQLNFRSRRPYIEKDYAFFLHLLKERISLKPSQNSIHTEL